MLILLLLCLSISVTSPQSLCFEVFPGKTLIGSVITVKRGINLKTCQNACLEMDGPNCRSITYSNELQRCELNSEDKDMDNAVFVRVPGRGDYYHRICYDKPSIAIMRDEGQFQDTCYEVTKGKVLIGIVDQLIQDMDSIEGCQKACQNSQAKHDMICKSAAYYKKEKECILASQSRHDIPDLYIDDENASYIENKCLTSSSDKKIEATNTSSKVANPAPTTTSAGSEGLETMGHVPSPFAKIEKPAEKPNKTPTVLEHSGYDSPSDSVVENSVEEVAPTTTTSTKATPTVDPKVVDSYAVEVTPKSTGYNRRLRDARVKTCFTEVIPMFAMSESRISKAYSLEQCTDICRLCWRCLRGKKCQSVAYDASKELCALSLSPLIDGGEANSEVIYHNRGTC